ncbi:hypothetical protein GHT06_020364 [Daphnia sinensis]|uniref:Uncharacterized protein n=1 Tax=Daphnia sinensis TaxID=1820382 RepID=A0AAD5KLB6_9CRUS|nr:hypothetical protein GHT06_020364 [Daphnia sinensis]
MGSLQSSHFFFLLLSLFLLSCGVTTTTTRISYGFFSAISNSNAFKHQDGSHAVETSTSSSAYHTSTVTVPAWWRE